MDVNGAAAILTAVILAVVGVYKQYPKFMSRYAPNGEESATPKPTLETLNSRLETLEKELNEARQDRDEAIAERDKAREEIGKLRTEFQQQIANLQKQIDNLNNSNEQQIRETVRVTGERDKLDTDYKTVLREYTETLKLVKSLTDEINDLEIRVDGLTIDNKAHKSLDVLVDEFSKRLIPALLAAVRDAIHSTSELKKVVPQEANPS